jgi:hypothetical protein
MKTVPPTPPRFNTDGYECELPESFFVGPRRPRILARPKPASPATRLPAWLLAIAAALLFGTLTWISSQRKVEPLGNISRRVTEPVATPTAVIPRLSTVARAELVKLPPPRATLVRLPTWQVDTERELLMPYGLKVSAHLRGSVASTDMLPANGNQLGDTWVVGDTAWVWLTQPGATQASWIDP